MEFNQELHLMSGTQQVLNYCAQKEELENPSIPSSQVSSPEHGLMFLRGGELSGEPKDRDLGGDLWLSPPPTPGPESPSVGRRRSP